jgi:hypothetical protein
MRIRNLLAACGALALAAAPLALAESDAGHAPGMMHDHHHGTVGGTMPTLPGQDAFGAVQEIVRLLEADPATDWTKVRLGALREHLVDMNEVTLHAAAAEAPIDGGLDIAVTGAGRTLEAIRRLVPAQAREIDGRAGWSARSEALPDGVRLIVTAADAKEAAHIRGLGFIGLMATGEHHQAHHLAIARGERHLH